VGVRNFDSRLEKRFLYYAAMLFLLSLMIRAFAGLLAGRRRDGGAKDLEILVLRHQLRVLRRKSGRPKLKAGGCMMDQRKRNLQPSSP